MIHLNDEGKKNFSNNVSAWLTLFALNIVVSPFDEIQKENVVEITTASKSCWKNRN